MYTYVLVTINVWILGLMGLFLSLCVAISNTLPALHTSVHSNKEDGNRKWKWIAMNYWIEKEKMHK